jgi:ABC-2 type transport system ATP-binding protein
MAYARRGAAALAELDLIGRADVRVRSLSGGELRRLDLACTLLGDPDVVLLDEPTTGLDPENRRRVWDLVAALRDRGRAVLLTTHHLEEAEELADRVAIMHAGRIAREGTPAQLGADQPSTIRFETDSGLPDLDDLPSAVQVTTHHGMTTVHTQDLQLTLHGLLERAAHCDVRLANLQVNNASLEAVFLAIASSENDPDEPAPSMEGAAG